MELPAQVSTIIGERLSEKLTVTVLGVCRQEQAVLTMALPSEVRLLSLLPWLVVVEVLVELFVLMVDVFVMVEDDLEEVVVTLGVVARGGALRFPFPWVTVTADTGKFAAQKLMTSGFETRG